MSECLSEARCLCDLREEAGGGEGVGCVPFIREELLGVPQWDSRYRACSGGHTSVSVAFFENFQRFFLSSKLL